MARGLVPVARPVKPAAGRAFDPPTSMPAGAVRWLRFPGVLQQGLSQPFEPKDCVIASECEAISAAYWAEIASSLTLLAMTIQERVRFTLQRLSPLRAIPVWLRDGIDDIPSRAAPGLGGLFSGDGAPPAGARAVEPLPAHLLRHPRLSGAAVRAHAGCGTLGLLRHLPGGGADVRFLAQCGGAGGAGDLADGAAAAHA